LPKRAEGDARALRSRPLRAAAVDQSEILDWVGCDGHEWRHDTGIAFGGTPRASKQSTRHLSLRLVVAPLGCSCLRGGLGPGFRHQLALCDDVCRCPRVAKVPDLYTVQQYGEGIENEERLMNINSIGSASTLSALSSLSNTSNTDATQEALGIASTPASSTSVSKPGELLNKLSQLLQQDPAKFKQVTQQISDELKTAAQSATGPQASFLSKLSGDFAQASSSGSLTSLQPNQSASGGVSGHHHHHGGGHHGGGGGGVESVLSTALDQVNQALSGASDSIATLNADPSAA
jgi:hypothetical protein